MPLQIRETYVNQTRMCEFGRSEWFEPFTDNVGKLFRALQREYGRCTGRSYRDLGQDDTQAPTVWTGWVFEKRMRYEDARGKRPDDYYIREVWVEVFRPAEPGTDCDDRTARA